MGDETYVFDILDLTDQDPHTWSLSSVVGEYYGSVAVSTTHVFVTGSAGTIRLPKDDLDIGNAVLQPQLQYSIVTNLANQQLYALSNANGEFMVTSGEVIGLIPLKHDTGLRDWTKRVMSFTEPIYLEHGSLIYSGYNRVLLGSHELHVVNLLNGRVEGVFDTVVRSSAPTGWANLGIVEFTLQQEYSVMYGSVAGT